MTTSSPLTPATMWTQALQTWSEGWAALAGQSRADGGAPADPFQLWRRSFDQWLGGWSAFLEGTLQTPQAAAASGRMLDTILNVEKPLREQTAAAMEYWLEFFNLPSRNDMIRVASQLNDANARLDELQDQVETLSDQVTALQRAARQPAATPAGAAVGDA